MPTLQRHGPELIPSLRSCDELIHALLAMSTFSRHDQLRIPYDAAYQSMEPLDPNNSTDGILVRCNKRLCLTVMGSL